MGRSILLLSALLLLLAPSAPDGEKKDDKKKKEVKAPISEADKKLLNAKEQEKAATGIQKARRVCLRLDLPRTAPGGVGSSAIVRVDTKCIVITNAHCVTERSGGGIKELEVYLPGDELPWQETFYKMRFLKLFPKEDLAFYELIDPKENVPVVELFTGKVENGTKVATVGWPWGRGHDDGFPVIDVGTVLKVDAAIWVDGIAVGMKGGGAGVNFGPGSSGGLLVDLEGRLLGINQKVTSNGTIHYVCAIPASVVKKCLDETMKEAKK